MEYAIRLDKDGKFIGYLKNIGYDLITGKEYPIVSRHRKDAKKFRSKFWAKEFISLAPDVVNSGYEILFKGKRGNRQ